MIILYFKDAAQVSDCSFCNSIPDIYTLEEEDGKFYQPNSHMHPKPLSYGPDVIGWFAVPEQQVFQPIGPEDTKTIGELNLHYDWPEGFIPLPGTGIPEKVKHIENFLTKMFPTRGI